MDKIKRFVKTSLVYFVGQVLSKLVVFFLLPLYTSNITPDQMGYHDIAITIINLIVPVVFVQIWDGAFRFAFDKDRNYENHFLINNSLVVFAIELIPCLVLLYGGACIFRLEYKLWILLYGVLFCLQYIYTFSARMYLDNKLFVFSGVACTVTNAVVNLVLILKFNMGIESLYIAQIAGYIIQIGIIEVKLGILRGYRAVDYDRKCISEMIRFTIPLCVTTISYWLLSGLTKIIINRRLGTYENGIYSIADKFATAIAFVTIILQYAWNETVYISLKEGEGKQDYSSIISFFIKTMLYAGIGLCLLVKLLFPYLIDSQYLDAKAIIPATIMGAAFNAAATLLNPLLMAEKKTSSIMVSTMIGAAVNAILSLIASKWFGLQGICISLALAFLTVLLIKLFELKKITGLNLDKTLMLDIVVCIALIWTYYRFDSALVTALMIVVVILAYCLTIRKYVITLIRNK